MVEAERIAALERGQLILTDRVVAIEKSNAVAEAHHNNVEKRLTDIESTLTWLVRLIIGALILAALGFAMNGGFNG